MHTAHGLRTAYSSWRIPGTYWYTGQQSARMRCVRKLPTWWLYSESNPEFGFPSRTYCLQHLPKYVPCSPERRPVILPLNRQHTQLGCAGVGLDALTALKIPPFYLKQLPHFFNENPSASQGHYSEGSWVRCARGEAWSRSGGGAI